MVASALGPVSITVGAAPPVWQLVQVVPTLFPEKPEMPAGLAHALKETRTKSEGARSTVGRQSKSRAVQHPAERIPILNHQECTLRALQRAQGAAASDRLSC